VARRVTTTHYGASSYLDWFRSTVWHITAYTNSSANQM